MDDILGALVSIAIVGGMLYAIMEAQSGGKDNRRRKSTVQPESNEVLRESPILVVYDSNRAKNIFLGRMTDEAYLKFLLSERRLLDNDSEKQIRVFVQLIVQAEFNTLLDFEEVRERWPMLLSYELRLMPPSLNHAFFGYNKDEAKRMFGISDFDPEWEKKLALYIDDWSPEPEETLRRLERYNSRIDEEVERHLQSLLEEGKDLETIQRLFPRLLPPRGISSNVIAVYGPKGEKLR